MHYLKIIEFVNHEIKKTNLFLGGLTTSINYDILIDIRRDSEEAKRGGL